MFGVTFTVGSTSKHTYTDWSLVLMERDLSPAVPRTSFVEIEGADGFLDFTEALGVVRYQPRTLNLKFAALKGGSSTWHTDFASIVNFIQGKSCKIAFDDETGYYYEGRVTAISADTSLVGELTITLTCQPYRLKSSETTRTVTLTSTAQELSFTNERKPVVPTLVATGATTIVFEDTTYTIAAGTHKVSGIMFGQGTNAMTVSGDGTLTITYREGSL